MATVSPGLRPSTSGVTFTASNNLRTRGSPAYTFRSSELDRERVQERLKSPTLQVANPKLSVVDIENMLRERITKRGEDLYMAFRNYDVDKSLSVTKVEFRRVLESYCLSLTNDQFESVINKVDLNPNKTVRYCDFMEKFGAKMRTQMSGQTDRWVSSSQKFIRAPSPKEMNTDMIEKMLKEKIQANLKNVIKGFRLYDYNRDGHIQKHELRKVLENYCFRMTDQQFDKLYQRYDFHHRGMLDYKDFLQRLGLHVEHLSKRPPSQGLPSAFNWQDYADQQRTARTPQLHINTRPHSQDNPGTQLAGMALHSLEVEFRQQMRQNYPNIKRMFLAFDQHLDGFIHLEDLKSVLEQFTIPMSNQLFSQLMDRCGIKASGKISWEYFLEKFQDPQSHGNGQTITIKPSHKFHPIRGADESMRLGQIVKLLIEQVHNGYSTLKQAFLEMDKNRDGKITRKELKKVLNTFKVRIPEEQFGELFTLLDPSHSNIISYHRFLDLFEERETKEGHKWLKSCHRFNDKQKPVILAWETVEEIVRDKIEENWKDMAAALVRCDNQCTRRIYPKELRQCTERFSIPISDDHFTNLMSRLEDSGDGKVNYLEFLTKLLGVTVKPGDLAGLSAQIYDGSNETEDKRVDEQNHRQARSEQRAQHRTDGMDVEEIIMRIKDHMSQGTAQIRKAFLKYDTKKNGKVSKKSFRQILETFGFYMSNDQFEELCVGLNFKNGVMIYTDFVESFEDLRSGGPAEQLVKVNNHRVNKIRGDEYGMTALEVESKLRNKLRENFEDLRGAFYKFDVDHNGLLTRGNFRRMLDAFMCPMADDEFDTLCSRLGVDKKTRLSYQQFLDKFEVRDQKEGHKWLISNHRYNEVQPVKLMTSDEVHSALIKKAHQQFADLSKAFRMIDKKKGVINKSDLRAVLQKFILPMKNDEFTKLWQRYDPEGRGHVTHEDFLKRLVGEEFAPSDLNGFSYNIIKESYKKLDTHHRDQQVKHEAITAVQAHHAASTHVDSILQHLKDRIREQHRDFYTAFKKYDSHKRGYLTSNDIQRVLTDCNYFVDDDQFYDLLERLGLHEKRRLTYEDFLKGFQEGRKDAYQPKDEDVSFDTHINNNLTPEAAVSRLHGKIAAQLDTLQKAFQAFDRHKTGHVLLPDFRRVLDNFCFKLSESQFRYLATNLPMSSNGSVDYPNFLETFKMSETDADKWLATINRRLQTDTPQILTEEDVTRHTREQVAAKFHHLSRAFADIDYARIGVISKEDFRDVLNKFTIRINEDQFEKLWTSQNVNEFGNLDYHDFLRRYTSDLGSSVRPMTSAPPHTADPARRPNTASSELARINDRTSVMSGMSTQRPFTPMVNAENVERRLKEVVHKHWKDIQRNCRAADTDDTGQISYSAFKHIMSRIDGNLGDEDLNILFLKYDLKNNNHFCYSDFLRHFVLTMQPQREASLLSRRKNLQPKVPTPPPGIETGNTARRVRECVSQHWKEMRHDFSNLDRSNTGVLPTDDVRQVLRNYNANLEEYEFHSLMSLYDKDLNGKVNYNNFLKAFLKAP